jgi:hypothetical protein
VVLVTTLSRGGHNQFLESLVFKELRSGRRKALVREADYSAKWLAPILSEKAIRHQARSRIRAPIQFLFADISPGAPRMLPQSSFLPSEESFGPAANHDLR